LGAADTVEPVSFYVRHEASLGHDTGGHPESAERLVAIEEELSGRDWLGLELIEAPRASVEQIGRVHTGEHIRSIEALCQEGRGKLDVDTVVSEGSWEAALRSAGGAVRAVEGLHAGEGEFAFCGLRPPGHHAERARGMGFCLFNNVAVGCAHALAELGYERALILDWDVHHGNGTEEIFRDSDRVLYASIHQSPLYPGTGDVAELGSGEGKGYTVNLPVTPGAGSEEFRSLVQHVVVPIALELRPDLIAVSAGYDSHQADPLGSCLLDEAAFADMAASVRELAAGLGAPVLVCLEGGYDVGALAASVAATIEGLSGTEPPAPVALDFAAPYRERLAPFWPSLG
jgi:acetoin utilization deacetylase AcuC-like enzyme